MTTLVAWCLAVMPMVPLTIVVINLVSWRRVAPAHFGRAAPDNRSEVASISLLIPARNEERNIEECIRGALASGYPFREIIVYDDESTDATPDILARLACATPQLRVLRGKLAPGWIGKPYACQQLLQAATSKFVLFIDSDVRLHRMGVERLLQWVHRKPSPPAIVSAVPGQSMVTFAERLVMPLLHVTYMSWLPLVLVERHRDPRFVAANGQLLLAQRDALERLGGFRAVAHDIVDDVALLRHAKREGVRVAFVDGTYVASCRMYRSGRELWSGFTKNIFEGLGGRLTTLSFAIGLHLACFVLPYALLLASLGLRSVPWPLAVASCVGVCANTLLRALLALRFSHPPEGMVLQPLAVVVLCALAIRSAWCGLRGELSWAGRKYVSRGARLQGSP